MSDAATLLHSLYRKLFLILHFRVMSCHLVNASAPVEVHEHVRQPAQRTEHVPPYTLDTQFAWNGGLGLILIINCRLTFLNGTAGILERKALMSSTRVLKFNLRRWSTFNKQRNNRPIKAHTTSLIHEGSEHSHVMQILSKCQPLDRQPHSALPFKLLD